MKRLISLCLCAALCLSLCACGGSTKHDRLLKMLDEHDYTAAVEYINRLAYEYAEENTSGDQQEFVYTAALTGEWIAYGDTDDGAAPALRFNADGTCTVDGNAYLWTVDDEQESSMQVCILDGAERKYNFALSRSANGVFTGNSGDLVEKKFMNFYNPAHFEQVEITPENWSEYFDDVAFYTFQTNDFGEVTDIYANGQWKLKDAYYSRLWYNMTNIAVEYSFMNGRQPATWDLAAKTCQLTGEWTPNTKDPADSLHTKTETLGKFGDSSTEDTDDEYYGFRHFNTGTWTSDGETYFGNYHKDTKIVRVQGSLWLVKEEMQKLKKTAN